MRVLTFLHSFEPGGVERIALRLHRAWLAQGSDSHLVMGRADGAMADLADGLPVRILSNGRWSTARWETLFMICTLPRVVRQVAPDVLFCAGNSYAVVAVALKLILGRRCPPIVAKVSNDLVRRDYPAPVRAGYRRWLRLQGRFIDRFVAIAAPMRGEIEHMIGVDASRTAVINDPAISAIAVAELAPARAPVAGRHFVGIGRLSRQKNFAVLLRAFARIVQPNDTLTIYGDGAERDRLLRLARALGVADQFVLPGYVTDLSARLAAADVFILSSDYEGVPAVLIDALAAGVAIVATDCSVSIADMLDDGQLGAIVPVGDAAMLGRAITQATINRPDRAAMRAQALAFTIERAAPAWWALFTITVAPSRPEVASASPAPAFVAND